MTLDEFQVQAAGGRIFGITFVKRTTGETRDMNCRCGVTRHEMGGSVSYDPAKHKLLPVFDLQKQGYRQIPLDGITELRWGGKKYLWDATVHAFVLKA